MTDYPITDGFLAMAKKYAIFDLTEEEQRAAVVKEARSWIGTPYHHCADVKGSGIDCGMLLVRVFVDLGLVPPFDPRPYSTDWHLHRSEEKYLGFIGGNAKEVFFPLPGDIIVWKIGRTYSHGAICVDWDQHLVVHASRPSGVCLEETVHNGPLRKQDRKCYSYWTGR